MKRKFLVSIAAMALLLVGLATVAFAADNWKTPVQIVSDLTGKTVDQAQAATGRLSQLQQQSLAQCKQWLDEAVKSGQMTQAEADKLYEAMKARMAACVSAINANGFGYGMMGRGMMGSGRLGGGCGRGYGLAGNGY